MEAITNECLHCDCPNNIEMRIRLEELRAENQRMKALNEWIPVSETPNRRGHYWCQLYLPQNKYRSFEIFRQREQYFDGKHWRSASAHAIIAWKEHPEDFLSRFC